jgi:carboxypeptidase Taq
VRREVPGLEDGFRRGEFEPLLEWLHDRVLQHGMRWRADELCRRATGAPLSHEPLFQYLEAKLVPLYGLS